MSKELTLTLVLGQLQGHLAELDRQTPLAPACSEDALSDHENWMAQHDHICKVVQWAEWSALLTVPDEVAELLQAITARKAALFNRKPIQVDTLDK